MKSFVRIFLGFFIVFVISTVCYAQSQQVSSSVERIRNTLPEDAAVLIYANVEQSTIVQLLITKENISGFERPKHTFVQDIMTHYGRDIRITPSDQKTDNFTAIIEYYRTLLQQPEFGEQGKVLGQRLYDFLLGNIYEQLRGKTRVLIIPDGILYFLPFEALVDGQGKYLAETYHVSYVQSLNVSEQLQKRQYSKKRKSMLAVGGAVYDAATYRKDMSQDVLMEQNSPVRGIMNPDDPLKNLPGTLYEVNTLHELVNGADILTGGRATESAIKELSASGELAGYKVLHFATYGIANTETPELSALVLSLSPGSADETSVLPKDGYLRASEIAQLQIKAAFVNLAASETGLGKIYGGEGVVGLTDAFLVAGANGISVSLWQVADNSTAEFMIALYKFVEQKKLNYAAAMTEVKRHFMNGNFGDKWKAPYYWAPFVYYGR